MSGMTRQSDTLLQFLDNYCQLWTNGCECSLTFNAKNGNGWANLSVCLGLAQDNAEESSTSSTENFAQQSQSRNGPSQQRGRARRAAARAKRNAIGTEIQEEKPIVVKAPVQEAKPSYAAVLSGEDKTKSCILSRNHSASSCMEMSGNNSGGCQFADKYDTGAGPLNKLPASGEKLRGNQRSSSCMEVSGNSSGGRQFADRFDTAVSPTNKLQVNGDPEKLGGKSERLNSCDSGTHSDPGGSPGLLGQGNDPEEQGISTVQHNGPKQTILVPADVHEMPSEQPGYLFSSDPNSVRSQTPAPPSAKA